MGKFKACVIAFKNKKEVFREGELVSGALILEVLEPLTVKAVRVYCCGEALTKWSREFSRDWSSDNIGSEKYYNQCYTVFGKKLNVDGPNVQLTAGKHVWGFAFKLPPTSLPSSYEGEYGAIRWWLRAEVDKPFPAINNKWYRSFTVLSKLDLNEPVYAAPQSKTGHKIVSKALGIGNAGSVSLSVKTDRFGYCPGECIALNIVAENNSTKDMGRIQITLVQRVVFTANDDTKSTNLGIASMETEVILSKGETLTLKDLLLRIPATPPSTRKRTCHIISVTYSLKVTVQVPWGVNLDLQVPIAIGTIPRGKKAPPLPAPGRKVSAQTPADPATDITYRRCEVGITPCRKSNNNFPNFPITPMCPYVDNYVYNPTVVAAATGATPYPPPQAKPEAGATGNVKAMEARGATPPPPTSTLPSAPPAQDEMVSPPSYEDVLRMDEQSQGASAQPVAPEPPGRACCILLVRFPDSALPQFRDTIQRDHNSLMDSELAFVAALAPQPLTGLFRPHDGWPVRTAVALLVFPDKDSAEEWMKGLWERGDTWQSECDAALFPAKWNVPEGDRPTFNVSVVHSKETVTRQQIVEFSKNMVPKVVKLRQDNGGIRVAASKDVKMLSGKWIDGETLTLTYWPHVDNYFSYRQCLKKGVAQDYLKKFQTMFDSYTVLLVSEDVSVLRTLASAASANEAGDDDNDNLVDDAHDNDADDETQSAENLLMSAESESK